MLLAYLPSTLTFHVRCTFQTLLTIIIFIHSIITRPLSLSYHHNYSTHLLQFPSLYIFPTLTLPTHHHHAFKFVCFTHYSLFQTVSKPFSLFSIIIIYHLASSHSLWLTRQWSSWSASSPESATRRTTRSSDPSHHGGNAGRRCRKGTCRCTWGRRWSGSLWARSSWTTRFSWSYWTGRLRSTVTSRRECSESLATSSSSSESSKRFDSAAATRATTSTTSSVPPRRSRFVAFRRSLKKNSKGKF